MTIYTHTLREMTPTLSKLEKALTMSDSPSPDLIELARQLRETVTAFNDLPDGRLDLESFSPNQRNIFNHNIEALAQVACAAANAERRPTTFLDSVGKIADGANLGRECQPVASNLLKIMLD